MIFKGTTPIQAIKLGIADVQRVMYNGAKIWPGDDTGDSISVSPSSIVIPANGDSQTVTVTATDNWTVL
ncbi:MAG: hypothetical protein LBP72_01140 [Dysgonamonadaceae bacterium]|jgi:hypothetical protein|nr:hypothetical protein [Dysgonamonadaceae bacterium]